MTASGVKVTIQDAEGNAVNSFMAEEGKSFLEMWEDAWIEMPYSCCSGACFVCAAKVIQWQDSVDAAKLSVPLVDVEDDQVLTCISWVKDEFFSDGKFHEIVLQKLM